VTFGIKQVPETVGITGAENPWADFNALLNMLHMRQLTGNAARDALAEMSQRFDSDEWNNFCAAVIRKDIRAGISDKTINKIVRNTKYVVPTFGCQLATNCEGRPEMSGRKRLEPKLDGVRMLLVVNMGDTGCDAVCFSRNGKVFDNFDHIVEQVMTNLRHLAGSVRSGALNDGFVLDGEVMGQSFQDLMRQARRKHGAQAEDSIFHVFDIIPIADFYRGHWNAQLEKRLNMLHAMRSAFGRMPNVDLLPSIEVDLDTAAGHDQLDRYAQDCVAQGFEGIMIKDLGAPYECKRNTFWLKWKPTISVDLEVVGVEEGTGKNQGRLGALVCSGVDHGKTIEVNVGSGFSDVERDGFWVDRDLVVGRTVEILADAVTQNQDGTYSLRFPRFLRFRDDK
jgi:DNA ligase-1